MSPPPLPNGSAKQDNQCTLTTSSSTKHSLSHHNSSPPRLPLTCALPISTPSAMPKSLSQAEKDQVRRERQAAVAEQKKAEKAQRDAQLKSSANTATSASHSASRSSSSSKPKPKPTAAAIPPSPLLDASLPGVNTVIARLIKLNPKLCITPEVLESKADDEPERSNPPTDSSSPSSSSSASSSFDILGARNAQLTFIDSGRIQRVAAPCPSHYSAPRTLSALSCTRPSMPTLH